MIRHRVVSNENNEKTKDEISKVNVNDSCSNSLSSKMMRIAKLIKILLSLIIVTGIIQFIVIIFIQSSPSKNVKEDIDKEIDEYNELALSFMNRSGAHFDEVNCPIPSKIVLSALRRSKTLECRQQILDISCKHSTIGLYPNEMENQCNIRSNGKQKGIHLGCYKDLFTEPFLIGPKFKFPEDNCKQKCVDKCGQLGYALAGLQYANLCLCGNEKPANHQKVDDIQCDKKCPGNEEESCGGYMQANIYRTGLMVEKSDFTSAEIFYRNQKSRVVFLLTLNGRAIRQVLRLIKRIYHPEHYYLIHIDSRQEYLFDKLLPLELKFDNIRLVKKRYATIWGGASLLQMLISCIKELKQFNWNWNFVINLSESDYPIKPITEFFEFIERHNGYNFVKWHSRTREEFIRKQGLDKIFYECENHMWKLGDGNMPRNLMVEGGSDWICLHRSFAEYITESNELFVKNLINVFQYKLLPAETFFHTALKNSKFCSRIVNNNLRTTNWNRAKGCKCQHKCVDWCGCSPNDFLMTDDDIKKFQKVEKKPLFFARKFEASISQNIINYIDKKYLGISDTLEKQESFWQNIYHHVYDANDDTRNLANAIIEKYTSQNMMQANMDTIHEITSYHHNDTFKNILILFSTMKNSHLQFYEALIKVKPHEERIVLPERDIQFKVGVNFDPKEEIFRDYFKVFGAESNIQLVYRIDEGETLDFLNLTFALYDPKGNPKMVLLKDFNSSLIEDKVIPQLKFPLLPGIWRFLIWKRNDNKEITSNNKVLAILPFLVVPTQKEIKPKKSHKNLTFDNSNELLKIFQDNIDLKSNVSQCNQPTDIKQCIQQLMGQFYFIESVCSFNEKTNESMPWCYKSEWSTQSPDPKSDISNIIH